MRKTHYIVIVLLALCFASSVYSQGVIDVVKKTGQTGFPFLKLDVGGRSCAMGGASTCVANDVTAMFSNLAGLAFVEGLDLMVNQTNWIADIKHYGAGIAYKLGDIGVFGVSMVYMDYGEFTETIPYDGTEDLDLMNAGYVDLGTFTVGEYAVGLSYARRISNQFSVGGQIKYAMQDLHESLMWDERLGEELVVQNKEDAIAFDFGTLYYLGIKDLRLGMSVRNFSRQGKYVVQRFELPLTMQIGVAMDIMTLISPGSETSKLTLAIDALHPRDYTERLHVGLEYSLFDMIYLRGGYKFNYDEEGLSAGVGLNKAFGPMGLKIDYAYGAFGDFFGSVHRFSFGFTLK